MEFYDSHAHYNDEKFLNNQKEIIQNVHSEGVTKLVVAGYNIKSSEEAIKIAEQYDFIFAICGISPNDVEDTDFNKIEIMAQNKKIVAIGEIGLDYYWNKENKELQKQAFIKQIEIANKLNLPIVIHCREAVQDTIDILKLYEVKQKRGISLLPTKYRINKTSIETRVLYIICRTNNI